MTISRESYEKHRAVALRLIRTTRDIERQSAVVFHSAIVELNTTLRQDTRRQLADLRYAYYRGMDDDT